jgi:hypothetical protein
MDFARGRRAGTFLVSCAVWLAGCDAILGVGSLGERTEDAAAPHDAVAGSEGSVDAADGTVVADAAEANSSDVADAVGLDAADTSALDVADARPLDVADTSTFDVADTSINDVGSEDGPGEAEADACGSGGPCVCDLVSCPGGCCGGGACNQASPGTCGVQGGVCVDCLALVLNATGIACTGTGSCDYAACLTGFEDLDGQRANGCETTTPLGVAEAPNLVLWLAGENWDGSTWHDASGAGRNATTYDGTVGVGSLNGRPVAVFNGGQLLISTGFPSWSAGFSAMTVASTATDDYFIAFGVSYNTSCSTTPPAGAPGCVPYDMLGFTAAMAVEQCDPGPGLCYGTIPLGVTGAGWVRTTAVETPGVNPSVHTYENGSDEGAGTHDPYPFPAPWATPRTDTVLGWRSYRGSVAELIVFNVPLSAASRQALDAYLANKWNVP